MELEVPLNCDLSGQKGNDCGIMGPQKVIKVLLDSCAASKLTEKHHHYFSLNLTIYFSTFIQLCL